MEGTRCFSGGCSSTGPIPPIFDSPHESVVVAVQRLGGPDFLDFSAENATHVEIGSMAFTEVSCDAFTVDYDLGEFGTGRLELQRLTDTKDFAYVE